MNKIDLIVEFLINLLGGIVCILMMFHNGFGIAYITLGLMMLINKLLFKSKFIKANLLGGCLAVLFLLSGCATTQNDCQKLMVDQTTHEVRDSNQCISDQEVKWLN